MTGDRTDRVVKLMRRVVFLVAVSASAGVLAEAAAGADEVSEAKEHYKKGTKAFELGAYDEAIAEYSAAYRLRDDPALLYNLAQAHRLADHPAEALRLYRMFLMKTPGAPNRDEVQDKIAELQKLVEQQRKAHNMQPDSIKSPGSVPPSETTPLPVAAAPVVSPAPPPKEVSTVNKGALGHSGQTKKVAGIAIASVGVGAIIGGIVCGVLAQNAGDKLTKLDKARQQFDYDQQQTGKTDQIAEGVLLGVGGAAVVAGVAVFILGHREQQRPRQVSIAPMMGRSIAGASLMGHF